MKKRILLVSLFVCALLCRSAWSQEIDERSYQLGILGGFSEVVRLGVKNLALSEVLSADEMDAMMADALIIAERNEVQMWRETELLVTDLYPADVAVGKHVLLIYTGDTLEDYLQLKSDKQALVASEKYSGHAREDIARRFGRMLSYPDSVIDELIAKQKDSN
jgi:hypothetical protein